MCTKSKRSKRSKQFTAAEPEEQLVEAAFDYIHYTLCPKYGLDFYAAAEALVRDWVGATGDLLIIDTKMSYSPLMERIQDWADRNGCCPEEAVYRCLARRAFDLFPTAEEDAEFKAHYARAKAKVEGNTRLDRALDQAVEAANEPSGPCADKVTSLPPLLPKKEWIN